MEAVGLRKAALYNLVAKYSAMAVQLIISMVLARLIMPEAFGVVAILTVITNFLALFSDMGLGISVVQNKELAPDKIRELFTFTLTTGLVLMGITCLLSYPVAVIYSNSEYYKLCPLISLVAFINSANVVPESMLIRDKRFRAIAVRTLVSVIISGGVGVGLAFAGWGAYALVFQTIGSSLLVFLWNYLSGPIVPKVYSFRSVFRVMGTYSLFQFIYGVINYFERNIDNLFIGAKFGSESLGYYNKAYSLNLYPNMLFTHVITGVLHPYVRDINGDGEAVMRRLMKILKLLSLTASFVMVVCYWCSGEIIRIAFGENWVPSVKLFHVLSLSIWAQMLGSVAGSFYLGLKRTDQSLKCGLIDLLLIGSSVLIGVIRSDLYLLALLISVSYNLIFLTTYYMLVSRTLKRSYAKFLLRFIKEISFCLVMIILYNYVSVDMGNLFLTCIVKAGIVSAAYILFLVLTGQIRELKNIGES